MKLTIHKLGPIDDAELEIRPLTVLIGKNGSGKTWAAHSLFKVLEQFRFSGFVDPNTTESNVVAIAREVAAEWMAKIDAAEKGSAVLVSARRRDLLARLPSRLEFRATTDDIADAIGTDPGPEASVVLGVDRGELEGGPFDDVEMTVHPGPNVRVHRSLRGTYGESGLGSFPSRDDVPRELERTVKALITGKSREIRALPAERVFLVNHFAAVLRDRSEMPWALRDFCHMLSEASQRGGRSRGSAKTRLDAILGGRVGFEDAKLRQAGDGWAIPIGAASSLTKSMAGLGVFLDGARPGDILVIDEPEMNAHPEAQVAIAELFALIIREGIRIVVATHSPYFVDRIASLLEGSVLDAASRSAVADRLALRNPNAYLLPEEVAVYALSKTGATELLDRKERTIDWSTFSDVSRDEAELYGEILDQEHKGDAA